MFPKISCLNDLLPLIKDKENIRVKFDETFKKTVVCYMIQADDLFVGENAAYEKECRGITFHETGEIACRTLHKFKNIGENESLQPQNIRWADVTRISLKKDGSMLTPVPMSPDEFSTFKFKTKKSFDTKEALLGDDLVHKSLVKSIWIKMMLANGMTPTFEVTSPRMPIVVLYKEDELTLLHIRENESGRYLTEEEIKNFKPPFPIVENVMYKFIGSGVPANLVSWDKLKEYAETAVGEEGVVIQFKSGDMVKLKTSWYVSLHRSITFTRVRDVARAVLMDQVDDLKGAFVIGGRSIDPIVKIEKEIFDKIHEVKELVSEIVADGKALSLTQKDMALRFNKHIHFGLIMNTFNGKTVDYLAWYSKYHLDSHSLMVIDQTLVEDE